MGTIKKVSGELRFHFESSEEMELKERFWQTKPFLFLFFLLFISPRSRPLIAAFPAPSSLHPLLFSGREFSKCACAMTDSLRGLGFC